MYTKQKK